MTDTISFGLALKAFRRGVHVFGPDWRGLVLCVGVPNLRCAVDEARRIFEGSSINAVWNGAAERFCCEPSDAVLQFRVVEKPDDLFRLAGANYTQIIWMYLPDEISLARSRALLRSGTIDSDKLRIDFSGL